MTTRRSASATDRHAKAKRSAALGRVELCYPTSPRIAASGVTSMAVKTENPETRQLIDEALARKNLGKAGTALADLRIDSRRSGR